MANQTTCFLILLFLALLLVSSLSTDAKIFNITTDQSALLTLKAHISYDPHHILTTNWSSSTSVCNWVGVTCGSRHHRVTVLNLSNNGLVGTIPPHIGNLSFLVNLNIRNNSFHGSMPNELSHLYHLKFLHFGYNEFSGEIPSWIGLLTKLQVLILVTNNFEGTIPSSLFNSTSSLQQIVLEDNQLWGSIPSSIFEIMSTLKVISLAENKFSSPMPSIFFNMSSLQYIDFSNNTLSGALPPEVGNLTMLTYLNLANNNFKGSQLPSSLFKCKQLQYLNLESNNLKGKLSPEIGNLTKLIFLDLAYNNFEALEYLHLGYSTPIVHCDLKPSNVLLDEDMVGHFADFGIAKLLSDGISLTQTMTMATIGYMAPEYGSEGIISTSGDVYSYGILLMETFTRKKPTDDMIIGEMS
ncbi:putative receptor-like protein kinase At3g47110 [Carya illinoinensis]|uniref:putative receptor-like protein kinase At3g47110 n=1 Tax=Carya illinoinensis TaxID=32201 RepID=UPI001C7199EC|nr:putative receptor-like protein kinase At3g47110 [Carya illinoinensis]